MSDSTNNNNNIHEHALSWMLTDARWMFQIGRKYSSMLILLCAVEAFAKVFDKSDKSDGKKYREFLCKRLPPHTRVQNYNIHVPKRKEMLRLEYILYKYLRNPMVHEGAHLDIDKLANYPVYIDWSTDNLMVTVDKENNRVVMGGNWIIEILSGVVHDAIIEDLTNTCIENRPSADSSDVGHK